MDGECMSNTMTRLHPVDVQNLASYIFPYKWITNGNPAERERRFSSVGQ